MRRVLAVVATLAGLWACGSREPQAAAWEPLPGIAPGTPYGLGVSALYAGTIEGALVAAGGANFPEVPAADGGAKRCYDEIWRLSDGASEWRCIGRLPLPAAYGATYAVPGGLLLAGGASAQGTLDAVWSLRIAGDSAVVAPGPTLPTPVEQGAAAQRDGVLYLAGGVANGAPVRDLFACDMRAAEPCWRSVAQLPEPLVQPVAFAAPGRIYIWGGYNPVEKRAVDYGYRYDAADGTWSRIAGVPDGGTLTGAAAAVVGREGAERLIVTGGVDREIFTAALRMAPEEGPAYLSQPAEAYRFRRQTAIFDAGDERWTELAPMPECARAGAALVATPQGLVLLNGEEKPGVRSPRIGRINLKNRTE